VAVLVWDKIGERQYETGVDRGVLYLSDGSAVVWNGLTSVIESRSRDTKAVYLDGIKYQDHVIPGDYSARLTAFTYPEELDSLIGNANYAPGVTVYDQPTTMFNLSYRTVIGNDIGGINYGYRIHIVYNVVAIPTDVTMNTVADTQTPEVFEWELKGAPNQLPGYRPTNHISIDSTQISPINLVGLESRLYGSATSDPDLPSFGELLDMVAP
jgi:hypothetical protein